MFSTTILVAIQMLYVKHLPVLVAFAFFLVFGFLDGKHRVGFHRSYFKLVSRSVLGCRLEEDPRGGLRSSHHWFHFVSVTTLWNDNYLT